MLLNNHKDIVISILTGNGITKEKPTDDIARVFVELCKWEHGYKILISSLTIATKLNLDEMIVNEAIEFWIKNNILSAIEGGGYKLTTTCKWEGTFDELKKAKDERLELDRLYSEAMGGDSE